MCSIKKSSKNVFFDAGIMHLLDRPADEASDERKKLKKDKQKTKFCSELNRDSFKRTPIRIKCKKTALNCKVESF